ncbi:MAG: AMP-binding protein [Acidimicrobiales bacterium]
MNLATVVDAHPADAQAVVDDDGGWTFGQLRERAARRRGRLAAAGVAPGDRVAIITPAGALFVETYLAVLGLGAIAVPLNRRAPAAELDAEVAAVGADVAVVAGLRDPGAGAMLRTRSVVIGDDEAADDGTASMLEAAPRPVVEAAADAPAVLLFTSGTAGAPRPAVLTHGNLRANLENVDGRRSILGPDDTTVCSVPLFHVMGLNSILGAALRSGATVVFRDDFDAASVLDAVDRHRATALVGPPTLWSALAAADPGPGPLVTITTAVSAAAPLDATTVSAAQECLGIRLTQGYGLTEASPTVSLGLGLDCPALSVGLPVPGVEVRIVDADGSDTLAGDTGEILVRGANVFPGYWQDPDATAAVLRDGWLHTGDIGVVDDGWLYLVDRAKELILVSGFNVHPGEVEDALSSHRAVRAAAAVGRPDGHTGERVVAYVVAAAGETVDPRDLLAHCRTLLAGHKCPREIVLVDELPTGLGGKVRRRLL